MSQNSGFSRAQCQKAIADYMAEVRAIMSLARNPDRLSAEDVAHAREQLKQLKARLNQDVKLRARSDFASMSAIEARVLLPALQQLSSNLHIRVNTRPTQDWYRNLCDVNFTLSLYMGQLDAWN